MARVRLDRMLVFDVEQTCWQGLPPPGQRNEIIEIGIVELLLDGTPRLGRQLGMLVKPVASEVGEYCTALTGITQRDVRRGGRGLGEVCARLVNEFGGGAKTWAAWGRDDQDLASDCAALGIEPPPMGGFVDLGALWGMLSGSGRAPGLRQAMAQLGLDFQGRPHRALPDAVNTARVVASMGGLLRTALVPVSVGNGLLAEQGLEEGPDAGAKALVAKPMSGPG